MSKKMINKITKETLEKSLKVNDTKSKIEKKRMELFKSMKDYIIKLAEECILIDFDILTTNDVAKIKLTVLSENKITIVFLINSVGMRIELDNISTKYGDELNLEELNKEYEKLLKLPIPEEILEKLNNLQKMINEK